MFCFGWILSKDLVGGALHPESLGRNLKQMGHVFRQLNPFRRVLWEIILVEIDKWRFRRPGRPGPRRSGELAGCDLKFRRLIQRTWGLDPDGHSRSQPHFRLFQTSSNSKCWRFSSHNREKWKLTAPATPPTACSARLGSGGPLFN
jgi:hypothetical protein